LSRFKAVGPTAASADIGAGADGSEKSVRQRGVTREGNAECPNGASFAKRVVKRACAGKKDAFRGNRFCDLQIHAKGTNKRKGTRGDFVVLEKGTCDVPISKRRLVNLALVEILLTVLVADWESENTRVSTHPLFLCLVGVSELHIATCWRSPVLPA
jgi:hypothetical protein